jgi:hypothetical protein
MLRKNRIDCLVYWLFLVENGIVTLAVDGEFEVKLGITNDNLFAPWHVYKTRLFLRDPEEPGINKFLKKSNSLSFSFYRTRTCSYSAGKCKSNIKKNSNNSISRCKY